MPDQQGKRGQERLKDTPHRRAIQAVLEQSPEPLDAGEIYLRLQAAGTAINLSSVYRILDALATRGILIKSNLAGGARAVYEPQRGEHRHNLVCSRCQRAIPVDGCPLEDFVKSLGERTGFNVTGHRLEIYGLCRECRGK